MAAFTPSPEAIVIPTRSFYSARHGSPKRNNKSFKENGSYYRATPISHKTKRRSAPVQSSINTNKGVMHKIRRHHRHDAISKHSSSPLGIDSILCNIRNENLRNRIETNRVEKKQIKEVHDILRRSQNPIELARPLRALNMTDDSNNNNVDAKSNRYRSDFTATTLDTSEFSDLDCFSDDMTTDDIKQKLSEPADESKSSVLPCGTKDTKDTLNDSTSRPETPNENRKFFKSRHTTSIPKEVKITENIKAVVCNGKITLVSEKRKLPKRPNPSSEFSVAQAAVDVIIRKLDDASEAVKREEHVELVKAEVEHPGVPEVNDNLLNEIELLETTDYSDFRKRIPFNTNDPVRIEEQHFLLDFLITHNICNEETFNIFIGDPENHKQEATKIVNEVLTVVNDEDDFHSRVPFNTNDPDLIRQQEYFIEFLESHNLLTEENFDIFIANYDKRRAEADAILANVLSNAVEDVVNVETTADCNNENDGSAVNIENDIHSVIVNVEGVSKGIDPSRNSAESSKMTSNTTISSQNLFPIFYTGQCQPLAKNFKRRSRTWIRGYGLEQYQIDAGQKEFGAKQCKQCGLVYGAHEPEEEKLHREFHSSLHVLRFKGWIDEDRVADFPEWGRDGRIIRITDSANIKRRERLNEILKIVDKELGFSSYIIPKTFVAYLAVRNSLIVGFCLVQPLNKANKYICSNGVDCCTVEEFEAKCGISRIWVSPLHRRMHIAKKLLKAVQMNTIMGEEIPLDKIAFSAPTEDGKRFAQKIMGIDNFLVYQ